MANNYPPPSYKIKIKAAPGASWDNIAAAEVAVAEPVLAANPYPYPGSPFPKGPKKKSKSKPAIQRGRRMSQDRITEAYKSYLEAVTAKFKGQELPKELEDIKYLEALQLLHAEQISLEDFKLALSENRVKIGKVSEVFGSRSWGKIVNGVIRIRDQEHYALDCFTYYWREYGLQLVKKLAIPTGYMWSGYQQFETIDKESHCCLIVKNEASLSMDMKTWDPALVKAYFCESYNESMAEDYGHTSYTVDQGFPVDKTFSAIEKSESVARDMKSWRSRNMRPSKKQVKKNADKFQEYQKKNGGLPSDDDIPSGTPHPDYIGFVGHSPQTFFDAPEPVDVAVPPGLAQLAEELAAAGVLVNPAEGPAYAVYAPEPVDPPENV